MTSRGERAETHMLTLPDFSDHKAVLRFLDALRTQRDRHGVKRLIQHCEKVLRYRRLQHDAMRQVRVALQVANGQRTALQLQKDHERGWRNTARRFYSGMTDTALYAYADSVLTFKPCILNITKEELIDKLVENYVSMKLSESTECQHL